ncbi:MAG: MFS transporter [Promethearchaeia archaeon]
MSSSNSEKLSKRNLFGYALGAIPTGLMAFIFSYKYIEFFFDDLRLNPLLFIYGQIVYMIVNAINDPLLGQLSDRTNWKKWGSRRLIYIRYGGPVWALTFILIWFPWSLTNQIIIFIHYTLSICLFDTFLTLVVLVWMALLPEMTTDLNERNKANFLSLVFGLLTVGPFFVIICNFSTISLEFKIIIIIIAIISAVVLIAVSYMCEERPELHKEEAFPLWKSVKETVKLKSFMIFIAYNFCSVFLMSISLSYIFVYVLVLGVEPGLALMSYFLIFIVIGYASQFYCMKLMEKDNNWDMRRIILTFGTLRVVGMLILFLIMIQPGLEFIIWIAFLWGAIFSGYSVFTTGALMYLSVDEDEVNHGVRREGMFLGINALFTKPASSLGPIIATIILEIFGYIQNSTVQPPSALFGIKILFILLPAIVSGISIIIFYFYPLHGEKLEELKTKLNELHNQKKLSS